MRSEQYELLSRLARLQKRSRSAVIMEIFETVQSVLERVAVVGEAAQRAQIQAKEGLRDSLERAEAAILPHVQEALGQFDMFLGDVEKRVRLQESLGKGAADGAAPSSGARVRRTQGAASRGRTPVSVTTGVRSRHGTHRKGVKVAPRKPK